VTPKPTFTTADPKELLLAGIAALGLSLSPTTVRQFHTYSDELLKWNTRINLTGLKSAQDIVVKHFLDSLAVWPWVQDLASLADIGSGAGFPGLPLKLALPHLSLTLVEPTGKKTAFLHYLIAHLDLANVEVRQVHLTPALAHQWGPHFQGVITRATFPLSRFLEISAPLVHPGGRLLALRGPHLEEAQWQAAVARAPQCGCRTPENIEYLLPVAAERRLVIIWHKVKNCHGSDLS
jgi:16S rRNA (guanine527-N7)-methyltransferase